jgi:hypothetical protein
MIFYYYYYYFEIALVDGVPVILVIPTCNKANNLCMWRDWQTMYRFYLGSYGDEEKTLLVNWDMICSPKSLDGLGIFISLWWMKRCVLLEKKRNMLMKIKRKWRRFILILRRFMKKRKGKNYNFSCSFRAWFWSWLSLVMAQKTRETC